MADPFRKVGPGQPFKPAAAAWNAFIDAASAENRRRGMSASGAPLVDEIDPANTCLVKWLGSSVATLEAFSVLAYGTPLNDPADNPFIARDRPIFEADAVTDATAPFVITIDQMMGQTIGRAVCSGLVPVQVDVTDATHTRAVPVASTTANLASASAGGVPMVWKESGTGTKWAVVLMGDQRKVQTPGYRPQVANLTENTSPDSGAFRTLAAGVWIDDGISFTNVGYPVQADGVAFVPKPAGTVLTWEEPLGSGKFALLPIQYAGLVSGTYYAGQVSTGDQDFKGEKTFVDRVWIDRVQYESDYGGMPFDPGFTLSVGGVINASGYIRAGYGYASSGPPGQATVELQGKPWGSNGLGQLVAGEVEIAALYSGGLVPTVEGIRLQALFLDGGVDGYFNALSVLPSGSGPAGFAIGNLFGVSGTIGPGASCSGGIVLDAGGGAWGVAAGGTGATSFTAGQLLAGNGTSPLDSVTGTRVNGEDVQLKAAADFWVGVSKGSF